MERRWFVWGFEGQPVEDPFGDEVDGRWVVPDGLGPAEVLDAWRAQAAVTDAVLRSATTSTRSVGRAPRWEGEPPATLERVAAARGAGVRPPPRAPRRRGRARRRGHRRGLSRTARRVARRSTERSQSPRRVDRANAADGADYSTRWSLVGWRTRPGWVSLLAASQAAPTMPAVLRSLAGDHLGVDLDQRQELVGVLADAAADDDQVGPEQRLDDARSSAAGAWPTSRTRAPPCP